jgi:hypothetical protein
LAPLQDSPFGHCEEQPIVPPQPFGALLQRPAQAFGFGWQHWPASQMPLLAHWIVPLTPQFTVFLQESVAVPHDSPVQALPVGTQASAPHVPQLSGRPQLSVTEPHRLAHHAGSCVQSHWPVDASQKTPSPLPQMLPQTMSLPQLSLPGPQWSTHHDTIGAHASASAASLASSASLASKEKTSPSPPPSVASSPGASVATSFCVVWSTGETTSCEAASGYGMPSSMPQIFAQPTAAIDAATHSATRPTRNQGRRAPRTIQHPL